MRRLITVLVLLALLALPARADMYPDASNASLPAARSNINASPGINIKDYGAKADLEAADDCAIGAGSTTLTCATAMFAQSDVGKRVVIDYAGAGGTALQTSVAGFASATSVTLAAPASVATPYFTASSLVRNPALLTTDNTVGGVLGYAPGNTITLAGGTGTTATVVSIYGTQVWAASIVAAGSGGTIGGFGDTGECGVRGTTGGTAEGTARAVLRVNLTAGAITGIARYTSRGFYTTNPTNPAAEPVVANAASETPEDEDDSLPARVPPCTGLTGGVLGFNMGPGLTTKQVGGTYSVAPANNVAQASTSGSGTGATFVMQYVRTGSVAVYTDNHPAFTAAINAANAEVTAGRRVCILIPAGFYGIRGSAALPQLKGPGCVQGESSDGSMIFVDPGYSGDVFAETDSWAVAFTIDGTIDDYNTQRHGSYYSNFSIIGDRLSANTQNGIRFYDRTDYARIANVTIKNLPGACLSFGTPSAVVVPEKKAGARATFVSALTCWRTGKDGTVPSVEYTTSGGFGAGPHALDNINIIGSFGTSLVVKGGTRNVKLSLLRIEGLINSILPNDLMQIGDPADTKNTQTHSYGLVSLVNIPPGRAGLSVNCNSTPDVPFGISFGSIGITGGLNYGKGFIFRCGRLLSVGVSQIATRDTNIEVAAPPATGVIEIKGGGGETAYSYGGGGTGNLTMPLRSAGTPGTLVPVGIALPYVVPGCQSGVPVAVRSATAVLAATCRLPPLKGTDRIEIETEWSWPASANAKTPQVRLNTASGAGGGTQYLGFNAGATSTSARCSTRISNAGSAFAQVASSSGCADTVGVVASKITSAINTSDGTAWINIQATGDAAGVAAAEDIVLLSWSVKVQPGS